MFGRWIVGGLAIALLVSSPALKAQLPRPLIPMPEEGLRVTPWLDGWYQNADGTVSLSFGYSNLNKELLVEIPLGPNNFITPKEYDGVQPTSFPVSTAANEDAPPPPAPDPAAAAGTPGAAAAPAAAGRGRGGPPVDRRGARERGLFTVTVPATFKGDVVWTLKYAGQTWSVPGRSKSQNYMLSWPAAMGSTPPLVKFAENGPTGRGPMGVKGPALQAKVGTPLDLKIWLTDDAVHDKAPIKFGVVRPGMNVKWSKHQGPVGAPIDFEPDRLPFAEMSGTAATKATFKEPGDYMVRVSVDTHGNADSSFGNQCCWTNGYQKVTVTR